MAAILPLPFRIMVGMVQERHQGGTQSSLPQRSSISSCQETMIHIHDGRSSSLPLILCPDPHQSRKAERVLGKMGWEERERWGTEERAKARECFYPSVRRSVLFQ